MKNVLKNPHDWPVVSEDDELKTEGDFIQRMIWKATVSPPPRIPIILVLDSCVTFAEKTNNTLGINYCAPDKEKLKHRRIVFMILLGSVAKIISINHTQNQGSLKTKMEKLRLREEERQEGELIEHMEHKPGECLTVNKYKFNVTSRKTTLSVSKKFLSKLDSLDLLYSCKREKERDKLNQFTLRNYLIKIHQYTQSSANWIWSSELRVGPRRSSLQVGSDDNANMCFSFAKRWKWNDQVCLTLPARLAAVAQFYPRFRRGNLLSIRGASGNLWKLNCSPMHGLTIVKWMTVTK